MTRMLAGMPIFVAMKTERGLIYALFSGTERRLARMIWICIIIDVTAWMSPGWMFGGFFFFWAFLWDGQAFRCKSSPKGCGLYSAIPNAWLKSPLAGVLLHTASCVLVMLLLNCRFFFSPSLARMFARWLVMFPLLRCNNSHIWLTVLSCSIKRQMFNSDGDKLGYILLIVSSLLFSFFWYAARAVKRFSLDCSPIMLNRELVFSSGLFSLNNSANANSSSFFIWRRFKSISSSSF